MARRVSKWMLMLVLTCFAVGPAQAYEKRDLLKRLADESQLKQLLVMNQAWVPYPAYADRDGWNRLLGDCREPVIRAAERYIGYDWVVVKATDYMEYEKSGSRNIMQDPNNKNTAAFSSMVIAELAEGKGRFLNDIVNGIVYFCEMTSWAESAHLAAYQKSKRALPDYREQILELHQGGKAQLLAWTYYFLKDQLDRVDPVIALRLRHELQKRELTPYLQRDDFWWMATNCKPGMMVNNWNPWCNSNALLCFMLLENDRDVLARAVYKSMSSVDQYLNYVKGDGACEEGPSYWGHAPGKLFDYLSALSMITGGQLSLFSHPMVKAMGEYMARSYIGDGWVVNFADASARGDNNASLIYRYGKAVGSEVMMAMAADRYREMPEKLPANWLDFYRELEKVRVMPLLAADRGGYRAPSFTWYPETEFCYLRTGRAFLAAKGGFNNESHNHNDVGTFMLYFDRKPLMIDAGVGTYTRQTFSSERYKIWTMQSNYHNLPMINGVPEHFGTRYKASGTKADGRRMTFSTDIAAAYPAEAGVRRWVRSYQLKKDRLLVSDAFTLTEAKAPNRINFLTRGDVDISRKGTVAISVDGMRAELAYDANTFYASVETVALEDTRLSNVWGPQLIRLSLTAKAKTVSGQYHYEIRVK